MSSNFLIFDENADNILSDVDYNSNTQRQSGVTAGIAQSALHNKLFYQTSTLSAAIAENLSNLGETILDSDYSGLIASIAKIMSGPAGVNAQVGTTYTFLHTDRNKVVTFSNAAAIAASLPAIDSAGFGDFFNCIAWNQGAGLVTITPTSGTINGAGTLTLGTNQIALIFGDASTYFAIVLNKGFTLLATASASASSSIDFTSYINANYDGYELRWRGLLPANDGTNLYLRISEDAGSTWKAGASDYKWDSWGSIAGAATAHDSDTADNQLILNGATLGALDSDADKGAQGVLRIGKPASATLKKNIDWRMTWVNNSGNLTQITGVGLYTTDANAINGIRFIMSAGNIAAGQFSLYGVA